MSKAYLLMVFMVLSCWPLCLSSDVVLHVLELIFSWYENVYIVGFQTICL